MTEKGAVRQEDVNIDSKLPKSATSFLLQNLQSHNLVYLEGDKITVNPQSRIKLAVKAVQLGADVENVSNFLSWQEFESIAALALEYNGYTTKKNMRFKHNGRRWEIDVVGCRKPLVLCVDCKHWHHGMHPSTLRKMVEAQSNRVEAFADFLPNKTADLPCLQWEKAKFIPIILSLVPFGEKFYGQVPVVPVLMLQDFISQVPLHADSLRHFNRIFSHL
jgi:Holliday junction resolvase-like predicted endonuclease